MSEGKRLSLGGRVATPRLSNSPSSMPIDQVLTRCIGAKIRVQTAAPSSRTVTGHIFAVSPSSPMLTLTSHPLATNGAPAQSTSYTLLPISNIQSFTLLELTSSTTPASPTGPRVPPPAALPQIDQAALQNRLGGAVVKLQAEEARVGKGVTAEAQAIFDALSRTLGCRWDGERIIVLDAVVIEPPYGPANCKAGKGVSGATLPRIKKVLESERKKLETKKANVGPGEKKGG